MNDSISSGPAQGSRSIMFCTIRLTRPTLSMAMLIASMPKIRLRIFQSTAL
ncbi:hypothetical protein D3C86_1504190 [compost metagenome]